jgi:predicted metal-dependent phosphoesterase TrpH
MRESFKKIDAIEVMNSSLRHYMNSRSLNWARRKNKAFTAGSDAHTINEFGNSFVASKASTTEEFLDSIKKRKNIILGKEVKLSFAVKSMLEIGKNKRQSEWN